MRIVHEAQLHKNDHGNCFVTLTYRDKRECDGTQLSEGYHVPADYSLQKSHFQKFVKRLRKAYPDRKIRYFHCGEYGEETLRPHYHACLFNVEFTDVQVWKDDEGIVTYTSSALEKLWPFGFATVGELNYDTAAYTAGYILKKVTGQQAWDHYLRNDENGEAIWVTPEYVTMSLKPGIGHDFYQKYKDDFFPHDHSPVPGKGVIRKVPRYYETILQNTSPDLHETVKQMRQIFIAEHGEDYTPERLYQKYRVHKARDADKKRNAL